MPSSSRRSSLNRIGPSCRRSAPRTYSAHLLASTSSTVRDGQSRRYVAHISVSIRYLDIKQVPSSQEIPHRVRMGIMRAISQRSYGGPEVLETVEVVRPEPAPGEVLVRVRAAGMNPADWKIRSGMIRRFGDPPFTLGLDF